MLVKFLGEESIKDDINISSSNNKRTVVGYKNADAYPSFWIFYVTLIVTKRIKLSLDPLPARLVHIVIFHRDELMRLLLEIGLLWYTNKQVRQNSNFSPKHSKDLKIIFFLTFHCNLSLVS